MSVPPALTGWVATYALHSTILLGLVLLVSARLESDVWRETLWKTALLGGLLTATLQSAVGYTPLVGRWALQAESVLPLPAERLAGLPGAPAEAAGEGSGSARPAGPGPQMRPADEEGAWSGGTPWTSLVVGAWVGVAALLLGRLALHHFWLFRVLAGRTPIVDGPIAEMLAALRRHTGSWAPVRLTLSAACPTPIALGRAEICVPERFLTDLGPDQQRSALAHELAHLRRRDPLWQLTAGIIGCVFFFQPLNQVARRRLREAAENLSDDWAVRHTGSALGLARCLTDIASWISPTTIPQATLAMAEGGSPLLRRVQRLSEWKEPPMYAAHIRPFAPLLLLALVAYVAPAASQRQAAAPSDPRPQAAPETLRATLGGIEVDTLYIERMRELGYTELTMDQIVGMLAAGVTVGYAAEMNALGFGLVPPEHLARWREVGVTPAYIAELRRHGYPSLSFDDVHDLKFYGVDGEYIEAMNEALGRLSAEYLISLRAMRVTPEYLREMGRHGLTNLSAELVEDLRGNGVTGEYIAELRAAGLDGLDAEMIANLRAAGVTRDYVRELAGIGLRGLSAHTLKELKMAGVTAEYVRQLDAAGLSPLTPDEMIRLRADSIDGS